VEWRRIREEQDLAYNESLEIDKKKVQPIVATIDVY
jgi:homoaconitase/3-isopropylmalate dehydratase large subunit